jgi:hypothetical protein
MIKVTYTEVKALHPCESGLQFAVKLLGGLKTWNAKPTSFADLRAAGVPPDDLVWLASAMAQKNQDVERRLRLWTADCAARVLHVYEKTGKSPAPRAAIVAARQFARGEISDVARAAAWDAARAAAFDVAGVADRAAARAAAWVATWAADFDVAGAAAGDAARVAARAAAFDVAWAAAGDAAWDAARDAAFDVARVAEEAWQFDRFVARMSDDEPEDWPLPSPPPED